MVENELSAYRPGAVIVTTVGVSGLCAADHFVHGRE